jgi:hypothetical protein
MRTFSATRLKQAQWQGAGLAAAETSAAVCVDEVDEAVCDLLARRAEVHHGGDRFLADRFPDGGVPLLPLALAVRFVAGTEQQPPAEGHRPRWRRSRCQVAGLTGGLPHQG